MIKKVLLTLTAAVILLSQSGCSSKDGDIFRYDLPTGIKSLDPQFTTDQNAMVIIGNIYEGLLRRKPDGQVTAGVAESYQTSPDGCTYTFYLRDSKWSDGSPVTAHDFVFGFQRMFMPKATSPYAQGFTSIKNATEILKGELPLDKLAVSAKDEKTLVIQLTKPDPFFIQQLCTPGAMPCNQKFFEETKGRYGLATDALLTNGPFKINKWDNEKVIVAGKNANYYDAEGTSPQGVYFYIAREDPIKLLFKEKSDLSRIGYEDVKAAQKNKFQVMSVEDTTWVLAFNQKNPYLADQRIRSALQGALDREDLVPILEKNMKVTASVVPPSASIYENPYRTLAGPPFEPIYNPIASKELFTSTLEELEIKKITGLTIIMPEYGEILKYAGFVQQMWQANLALFANIEALPANDFRSRVASGNYDIALLPLQLKTAGPQGVLSMFATDSGQNYVGFSDPNFDRALEAALSATKLEGAVKEFSTAEDILIESAAVVPLYSQTSYYAVSGETQGIEITPFGDIYFKNARFR